jgi:hypothetical protein
MSKERDLLEKFISWNNETGAPANLFSSLINEAEKLLSEPEEISLRDHFAGLAMQGFLTADEDHLIDENDIAEWAYDQADAMLRERNK